MKLWIFFVVAAGIWGSSFLFTAISLRDVPAFTLVTYRISLGAVVLGVWALFRQRGIRLNAADWRGVGIVGVFNVAGSFSLITTAQETLSSAETSVLVSALPIFSATLAGLMLPNEALNPRRVSGLSLGFLGVIAVFWTGLRTSESESAGASILAAALVLAAVVIIAGSAVYVKARLQHLTALELILPQLMVSVPITAAIAYATETSESAGLLLLPDSLEAWFAVIWLGALGAGVANIFFYRLIAGWGVPRTTLISYAMPVIGVFLGWLVLDEPLGTRLLLGTALILMSIALVSDRRTRGVGTGPDSTEGGLKISIEEARHVNTEVAE